jgi:hypothetical protein
MVIVSEGVRKALMPVTTPTRPRRPVKLGRMNGRTDDNVLALAMSIDDETFWQWWFLARLGLVCRKEHLKTRLVKDDWANDVSGASQVNHGLYYVCKARVYKERMIAIS